MVGDRHAERAWGSVPFLYNPAQGALLLDTRTYANMPLWMKLSGSASSTDSASRMFSIDLNATVGSRDTGADVLEFIYSTSP